MSLYNSREVYPHEYDELPVMFSEYEQELLNDPYEWDEEFLNNIAEEEAKEKEAFQVLLMNEEEMLNFANALEEYSSKKEEGSL